MERVNRTLKTALKCAESPTDWYDNLPWALLSLTNQPKEDLDNHSPNDFVFGGKLCLPGEFFLAQAREDETLPTREFAKLLAQRVASFRYHPPRKTNRSSHLDSTLFNPQVTHVFVKDDVRRHSLQPAYRVGLVRISIIFIVRITDISVYLNFSSPVNRIITAKYEKYCTVLL